MPDQISDIILKYDKLKSEYDLLKKLLWRAMRLFTDVFFTEDNTMKRLLLTALVGLTCAQQSQANDLIPASLHSAMPYLAGPTIGLAAGAAWTLGRAAHANYAYRAGTIWSDDQNSNAFINILKHGSQPGSDENPQFEPRYINNIGITWLRSIFLGATIGALYSIYKNGVKDGLKIAAGTFISAWALNAAVSNCICKPYYKPDLRTDLFLKG